MEISRLILDKEYKLALSLLLENNALLDEFMNTIFSTDYRLLQSYSHVLDLLKIEHQELLQPYYKRWISLLKNPHHDSFYRATFRYFQDVNIPVENQGELYDLAFNAMMSPKNAVAIRVFAMTTCFNIAKEFPELLNELLLVINLVAESESPGIKARSRHIIKKISKLQNR